MTPDDPPVAPAPLTRRALRTAETDVVSSTVTGAVADVASDAPSTTSGVVAAGEGTASSPALPTTPAVTTTAGGVTTTPEITRPRAPRVTRPPRRDDGHAPQAHRPPALAWVEPAHVLAGTSRPFGIGAAVAPLVDADAPDLLARRPRRSPFRPSVLLPVVLALLVVAAYSATTLLWPLNAIPPTVEAVQVQSLPAPAATAAWPKQGSAAVAVSGYDTPVASGTKAVQIASITKLVTALMVLDEMPLAKGEQGRKFMFGSSDYYAYQNALASGESALPVPVGGSLTEYQLLEGMLIGSAGNYAERLAGNIWPTDAVYASAATSWLKEHRLSGISLVEPTGIDSRNRATPAALIPLAQRALANPVIAEIVAKKSVKLPGAGTVKNTNTLLADAGVVGLKTGSLDSYTLLSAKDVVIGDTKVRLYASVLGQKTAKGRFDATRALFAQLEKELQPRPSVAAGTLAGQVTTKWGEKVDVVAASDADVVLWNGGTATVDVSFALDDKTTKGATVGSLSVTGPLDSTTVDLKLADHVEGPTAWWRLTHPFDLLGLTN